MKPSLTARQFAATVTALLTADALALALPLFAPRPASAQVALGLSLLIPCLLIVGAPAVAFLTALWTLDDARVVRERSHGNSMTALAAGMFLQGVSVTIVALAPSAGVAAAVCAVTALVIHVPGVPLTILALLRWGSPPAAATVANRETRVMQPTPSVARIPKLRPRLADIAPLPRSNFPSAAELRARLVALRARTPAAIAPRVPPPSVPARTADEPSAARRRALPSLPGRPLAKGA